MDNAHALPTACPHSRASRPLGEEAFLGRVEVDVLHEHGGCSGFTTMAKPALKERLEHLPEPWRKHAAKRLPGLRASGATWGTAGTQEAGGTGLRVARFQAFSAPQPVVSPLGPLLSPVIAAMRRFTRVMVVGERSCSSSMNP